MQGGPAAKRPRTDAVPVLDPGLPLLKVLVPNDASHRVIGERGATIGAIAKSTSTHLNISRDVWPGTASRVLTVQAKSLQSNVAGAAAEALRIASGDGAETLHAVLIIPVSVGPLIVGRKGARINELQEMTRTSISMKRPAAGADEEEMVVQGPFEGVGAILQTVAEAVLSDNRGGLPSAAASVGGAEAYGNAGGYAGVGAYGAGGVRQPKSQTPCKHFLSPEGCRKGSLCDFSHDFSSLSASSDGAFQRDFRPRSQIPCRFLLQTGSCRKGAQCDFSHDLAGSAPVYTEAQHFSGNASAWGEVPAQSEYRQPKSQTPCKFFLQTGSCRKGAQCDFSHDFGTGLAASGVGPGTAAYKEAEELAAAIAASGGEELGTVGGLLSAPGVSSTWLGGAGGLNSSSPSAGGLWASSPDGMLMSSGEPTEDQVFASPCFVRMQLPATMRVGSLIGRGGSFMKELHQETGANKLHVAEEADGRWLEITGNLRQVQIALELTVRRLNSPGLLGAV